MQIMQESLTVPGEVLEEREIPSDVALVTPLVVRLIDDLTAKGVIDNSSRMKVELCLDEAITNAVIHGNRSDFEKIVRVITWKNDRSWGVVIQDQGVGFQIEEVVDRPPEEDLWQESGRGIPLMNLYMDEVTYFDGGRTLLLRQHFA